MPIKTLKKQLNKKYLIWLVLILLFIAITALLVRLNLSNGEGIPANDTIYVLSYQATFDAPKIGALIRIAPPWDTNNAIVIAQTVQNSGLRLLRNRTKDTSTRDIAAVATSAGKKAISIDFTIHISPVGNKKNTPIVTLSTQQRERYLSENISDNRSEIDAILAQLNAHNINKNQLIDNIFKYITKNNIVKNNDTKTILPSESEITLYRARTMVALCRASKIPSRLVTGLILKEGIDAKEHFWVEIYDEQRWAPYDLENGYSGTLPANFVPARFNGDSIIGLSTASDIKLDIDITEEFVPSGKLGRETISFMNILDLTRLSLDARKTLATLLLLPLGALFTTFCRNMLGIRTYGTFTPSLLAFAAIYADWLTTMVILSIVAITGIFGRSIMPDNLSRSPRLTIVFTIVAMSMTLSVSIMDYYSFNPAGHIVLLPIIILTSLIDSLYKTLDEDGARVAVIRLGWTAIVALGCYQILVQEQIGFFILTYPEIHMITIGVVLLLSAYSNKKLKDFALFKWVAEPQSPTQDKKTLNAGEK